MKRLVLALFTCLQLTHLSAQDEVVSPSLSALRNGDFETALELLSGDLSDLAHEDREDELRLHQARAHQLAGQNDEAIKLCDEFLEKFPDSKWRYKVTFVKAQALAAERKFEAALKIYQGEAGRIFSQDRQDLVAQNLIGFAELFAKEPEASQLDAPVADYAKALVLLRQVLEMECSHEVQEKVRSRIVILGGLSQEWKAAEKDALGYLQDFDSSWRGEFGSVSRLTTTQNERVKREGLNRFRVRYHHAEALHRLDRRPEAVRYLLELDELMSERDELKALRGDAHWLRLMAMTNRGAISEVDLWVREARKFLEAYPKHLWSSQIASTIASAYERAGRWEEARVSYQEFLDGKGYEAAVADPLTLDRKSAANFEKRKRRHAERREAASFSIGEIFLREKKFDEASQQWSQTAQDFPNGEKWADCQKGLVNVAFQKSLESVRKVHKAEKKEQEALRAKAREILGQFLAQYPLDARLPQLMYVLGELSFYEASFIQPGETFVLTPEKKVVFEKAIGDWRLLVSKFPKSAQAEAAELKIAGIYENYLGDLEKAVEIYGGLKNGQSQKAVLMGKVLKASATRVFGTNEDPEIELEIRNIETLTVRQYWIDYDSFFRKSLDLSRIEELDVDLVEPDKTWEFKVPQYQRYLPMTEKVAIPFEVGKAGVCILKVEGGDLESTTVAVRSDIDLAIRSSRGEALVFVRDWKTGKLAAGVELLLAEGSKIIASGVTGQDGVWRYEDASLEEVEELRVLAVSERGMAGHALSIVGAVIPAVMEPRAILTTARAIHRPGETVKLKVMIRDVRDAQFEVPDESEREFKLTVRSAEGRLLLTKMVFLNEFGASLVPFHVPEDSAAGSLKLTLSGMVGGKKQSFLGGVEVSQEGLPWTKLALDFKETNVALGTVIQGKVSAKYRWGAPLVARKVLLTMPGGLTRDLLTDEKGVALFEYPTKDLYFGKIDFRVSVPSTDALSVLGSVKISNRIHKVSAHLAQSLVISGEELEIGLKAKTYDDQAVARKLRVVLEKLVEEHGDPVLLNVPGLKMSQACVTTREKVKEQFVDTDGKNGAGVARFVLKEGGAYDYLVFDGDQEVSRGSFAVSDDKDPQMLRLFMNDESLSEGMTAKIQLHSRLKKATPVLLTVERDKILEYRVLETKEGFNEISIPIRVAHAPGFNLHVMALDDRKLHEVSRWIGASRELKVEMAIEGDVSKPGEKVKVTLSVKDRAGNPVQAEAGLAIVRKDDAPHLVSDRFIGSAQANSQGFSSCSSCGFQHQGRQSVVDVAIREELERQLAGNDLNLNDTGLLPSAVVQSRGQNVTNRIVQQEGRQNLGRDAEGMMISEGRVSGAAPLIVTPQLGGTVRIEKSEDYRSMPGVTDENGVAVIEMTLPDSADEWVLLGEVLSINGRLGSVEKEIELCEDLTVRLVLPHSVSEGDQFVPSVIISRAEFDEAAQGMLKFVDAQGVLIEREVSFAVGESTIEISFAEQVVVLGAMEFTAEVVLGRLSQKDKQELQPSRWGAPVVVQRGILAEAGKTNFTITLPADAEPSSLSLVPQAGVSAALKALTQMRLAPAIHLRGPLVGQHPSGELLAEVSLLGYGKKRGFSEGELALSLQKIEGIVANLTLRQNEEGGWAGHRHRKEAALIHSAACYEGLLFAQQIGVPVDEQVLAKGQAYLKGQMTTVNANDRALIQQSLASGDGGDFSVCNRLYRSRGELSPAGQANLAMAFIHLKRPEFSKELLTNLKEVGMKDVMTQGRALQAWAALDADSERAKELEKLVWANCGSYGFHNDLARGFGVLGLASIYEARDVAAEDFRASISVNGKEVGKLESGQEEGMLPILIESRFLKKGENEISVSLEGRGSLRLGATATGLLKKFPNKNWNRRLYVKGRSFYLPGKIYRGLPLKNQGRSPARNIEVGERVRVQIDLVHHHQNSDDLVVLERIPAGFEYLNGSLKGGHSGAHLDNGYLVVTLSGRLAYGKTLSYELVAKIPGEWRLHPTAVLRAEDPTIMNFGPAGRLTVLEKGQKREEAYAFQISERYELAELMFRDGNLEGASEHLAMVREKEPKYRRKDVASMTLWIETIREKADARLVADSFEVLNELSPELEIPFEKILKVGEAYRELNEFERGMDVFLATMEAGFANESFVGAAIEDQGRFLDALDYQEGLWREFPDYGEISNAWFGLTQQVYQKAEEGQVLTPRKGEKESPKPRALYLKSIEMLERFRATAPGHSLADDAAFTIANTLFTLRSYEKMVEHTKASQVAYPDSNFAEAFQYLGALGNFWQRKYDQAFEAAKAVAEGNGKDKDLSAYICAQILHAQSQTLSALKWYEKVKGKYPDARDSIAWFEQKKIEFDEVQVVRSGEKAEFVLKHRNITKADLQIYRVDLMKFYLREKDLSHISQVNLAGIAPKHEMSVELKGDQFSDLETKVKLPLEKDGAYLIICRGDYLYTSGLVLLTPLKMETQENDAEATVRVNMSDRSSGELLDGVHVKAIGSVSGKLVSGETDLRGVWKAEGIKGKATVIARDKEGRYAFYRGTNSLGGVLAVPNQAAPVIGKPILGKDSYNGNNYLQQDVIIHENSSKWEKFRRTKGKGVKVNKAIKK